jgi:hypothetical protein
MAYPLIAIAKLQLNFISRCAAMAVSMAVLPLSCVVPTQKLVRVSASTSLVPLAPAKRPRID